MIGHLSLNVPQKPPKQHKPYHVTACCTCVMDRVLLEVMGFKTRKTGKWQHGGVAIKHSHLTASTSQVTVCEISHVLPDSALFFGFLPQD